MNNKKNDIKSFNEIYCLFDDKESTIKETLKVSFLDYLSFKEKSESLANTSKES